MFYVKSMPVVEKINKKGRYFRVYLDSGEEIRIPGLLLDKYGISVGSELEQFIVDELSRKAEETRAENYVTYLLSRRSYSVGVLKSKLEEKGYSEAVVKTTLAKFADRGLVDDQQFAREMTESILRNKPAGKGYIISRLRQKHIPYPMAKSIVEEFFEGVDETELAYRLLKSRWRHFSKFELESARRKAYNYLSRRSISFNAARSAFDKIVEEEKDH